MLITNYSNVSLNNNLVNHQVKDCIKLTVIIDFKFKISFSYFFHLLLNDMFAQLENIF